METYTGPITCTKHNTPIKQDKKTKHLYCPKCRRNRNARIKNILLRDICGISAAAARRDMGL